MASPGVSFFLLQGFIMLKSGTWVLRRLCMAVRHAGSGLDPETRGLGHLFNSISDHDTPRSQEK